MSRVLCVAVVVSWVGFASAPPLATGAEPLVIHEWGTFTSLQDERGEALGGINADDEPVPFFVHRIANVVRPNVGFFKGIPRSHPQVTMRLETPVIYFHPAPGSELPMKLDLEVGFRGGWLTEYYPVAQAEAPGIMTLKGVGPLFPYSTSRLRWKDLRVGTTAAGPKTDAHVWLAPRRVEAANVSAAGGESERYLFYRGIGNLDSPLAVKRDAATDTLRLTAAFPLLPGVTNLRVPAVWLVDIREDQTLAFRQVEGFSVPNNGAPHDVACVSTEFASTAFGAKNLVELRRAVATALVSDGLHADEAEALLNTWEASYFRSTGLRLFYLLPREWTDEVLPLTVSVPARTVRTMVGRIEIITPRQRQSLAQIAAGPIASARWLGTPRHAGSPPPPADYQAYQSLGRFRDAIVLEDLRQRPTPALKEFVKNYGLMGYSVPEIK